MEKEKLKTILEKHMHWLNKDCENWETMRADLTDANLTDANLRHANLRYADLTGADLTGADLTDANLRHANLRYADLTGADLTDANLRYADLTDANLRYADLTGADLTGADLTDANLRYADLTGADLTDANLRHANLRYADLTGADLRHANLTDANLTGADLRHAKNIPYIPITCPDFGSFVAYKKARGYIVELEIPCDAKRLSATTKKCRCDKAKVLRILNYDKTVAEVTEIASSRDSSFIYKVGEIVSVSDFDEDRWNECSTGIHFFINFQEAVNY